MLGEGGSSSFLSSPMKITTIKDPDLKIFVPNNQDRPKGLHLSDIIKELAKEKYPKWFKDYEDDDKERQIRHWEKGLILEKAWGDVLSGMSLKFSRPAPKKVDGVWCSPDGFLSSLSDEETDIWPYEAPLVAPSIHECKVTLKSCKEDTSPITHEKFQPWLWQVMGYCHGWKCLDAYIYVCHLLGDYGKRPWTPVMMVHYLSFDRGDIVENWDRLMSFAEEKEML